MNGIIESVTQCFLWHLYGHSGAVYHMLAKPSAKELLPEVGNKAPSLPLHAPANDG